MQHKEGIIGPLDILTFGFLIFLIVITSVFMEQIPNAMLIILVYAVLGSALYLLIYLRKRHDGWILKTVYNLVFPIVAVLFIFNSLGNLIPYINPRTFDHLLIRLDYMLLGNYPTVVLERITNPVITEVLQFAYISYYFLPVILGVALITNGRKDEFNRSVFLIILCFFLSYIGYILVPAIGPRYTMNHLQGIELQGIFMREAIDSTLNSLEGTKRDAFPSGHTAIALMVLFLANKYQKRLYKAFLPLVIAMIISTVYLRYHYVVDVIGGALLFIFTAYIGERYYNYWEKRHSLRVKLTSCRGKGQ